MKEFYDHSKTNVFIDIIVNRHTIDEALYNRYTKLRSVITQMDGRFNNTSKQMSNIMSIKDVLIDVVELASSRDSADRFTPGMLRDSKNVFVVDVK